VRFASGPILGLVSDHRNACETSLQLLGEIAPPRRISTDLALFYSSSRKLSDCDYFCSIHILVCAQLGRHRLSNRKRIPEAACDRSREPPFSPDIPLLCPRHPGACIESNCDAKLHDDGYRETRLYRGWWRRASTSEILAVSLREKGRIEQPPRIEPSEHPSTTRTYLPKRICECIPYCSGLDERLYYNGQEEHVALSTPEASCPQFNLRCASASSNFTGTIQGF
jgi:hypothetical protein